MGVYACNMYISIVDLNAPCSKKNDDVKINIQYILSIYRIYEVIQMTWTLMEASPTNLVTSPHAAR